MTMLLPDKMVLRINKQCIGKRRPGEKANMTRYGVATLHKGTS
jgi:hypothetical protein